MIAGGIDGTTVAAWAPTVHIADAVTERDRAHAFAAQIATAFDAPAVVHTEPQPLIVTGGRWVVVTEAGGLVQRTTYLIPRFTWLDAFRELPQPAPLRRWTGPMLIAGMRQRNNYNHWLLQSVGSVMVARALGLDPTTPVLLPPTDERLRAPFVLFGLDNPIETLPDDALAILTDGILSTVCSGDHGMTPHPAVLDILRCEGERITGAVDQDRRLYLSRRGASNGRVPLNEDDVCAALVARGFDVVAPGELPLEEQIRLFREAAVIVAPHGAAVTNIVWGQNDNQGPVLIELLQENFTMRSMARIAQAKRLTYHAVICECAQRAELLIDTRPRVDISLLLDVIDRL